MKSKSLAFYKIRPRLTLPCRPGAVQCVRNCANCIDRHDRNLDIDQENIIAIQSYDDLVLRKSLWFSVYKSILYHPGQVDIVRNTLKFIDAQQVLYIVACTRIEDLVHLVMVFKHENMVKKFKLIDTSNLTEASLSGDHDASVLPIAMSCCALTVQRGTDSLLNKEQLSIILKPLIEDVKSDRVKNLSIVPIVISKDHDSLLGVKSIFGALGSLCVQMLEPYPIRDYITHLHFVEPTNHLVQHIYHDLARHAARLPSHLVAFLLLYLNRDDEAISKEDLIDYVEWMRCNSLEFDLQIAFSGLSEHVVEYAIEMLKDYIHIDKRNEIYRPIKWRALSDYASTLAPNFACFGIICRAILSLHNSDPNNAFRTCFDPSLRVRVMKDDVIELSVKLAEKLDELIPCRRPCVTITTNIIDTFAKMQTFGKYFKIQEPKVRQNTGKPWCGDYDSDEDYYWSKRDDPAFKTWLVLTQRPYRLDRLNLFMNSVDLYDFT